MVLIFRSPFNSRRNIDNLDMCCISGSRQQLQSLEGTRKMTFFLILPLLINSFQDGMRKFTSSVTMVDRYLF